MTPTAGVILTGGASRRMGRTKALLEVDGVPMADRVAGVLRAVGCSPVLAVGGDLRALATLSVPVVRDRYPDQGPLGGLLHALEVLVGSSGPAVERVLVAACDLPDLTVESVAALLSAPNGESFDVVVAETDRMQPGLAAWSLSALPAVRRQFRGGERSLQRVVGELHHAAVAVDPAALRNVNHPDDLLGRLSGVGITEITVQDLDALGPTARIVDVREPNEWAAGHVPHAELVPLASVPDRLDAFDGAPTYVICRSGARSAKACEFVVANGGEAVNVFGGMIAWAGAGLPIETGDGAGSGPAGG